ncbi:hypothetical protein PUN28_011464 [Cardiocondyla obscurior]|uniref:Uncharacterized protein n=1 Tax=Cardiocondyla obscurior TaxID=286306 RepID=A0AAW2FHQ2_9HYME
MRGKKKKKKKKKKEKKRKKKLKLSTFRRRKEGNTFISHCPKSHVTLFYYPTIVFSVSKVLFYHASKAAAQNYLNYLY